MQEIDLGHRYPSILIDTRSTCSLELLQDILFQYKSRNVPIMYFAPWSSDVVHSDDSIIRLCPCAIPVLDLRQLEKAMMVQCQEAGTGAINNDNSEFLLVIPLKQQMDLHRTYYFREVMFNHRHIRMSLLFCDSNNTPNCSLMTFCRSNVDLVIQLDDDDAMQMKITRRTSGTLDRLQPTRRWTNHSIQFLKDMLCPECQEKQVYLLELLVDHIYRELANIVMWYSLEGCVQRNLGRH